MYSLSREDLLSVPFPHRISYPSGATVVTKHPYLDCSSVPKVVTVPSTVAANSTLPIKVKFSCDTAHVNVKLSFKMAKEEPWRVTVRTKIAKQREYLVVECNCTFKMKCLILCTIYSQHFLDSDIGIYFKYSTQFYKIKRNNNVRVY